MACLIQKLVICRLVDFMQHSNSSHDVHLWYYPVCYRLLELVSNPEDQIFSFILCCTSQGKNVLLSLIQKGRMFRRALNAKMLSSPIRIHSPEGILALVVSRNRKRRVRKIRIRWPPGNCEGTRRSSWTSWLDPLKMMYMLDMRGWILDLFQPSPKAKIDHILSRDQ